jgi:hypothetical protein
MMKKLFNIFKNSSKSIPDSVKSGLLQHFPKAINIEWNKIDDTFEAIFYLNEVEQIAKLSADGTLLETKKNLWLDEVPQFISVKIGEYGEMMSAIEITSGTEITYEIIIRKSDFNRFLLLFNNQGNLLLYNPV